MNSKCYASNIPGAYCSGQCSSQGLKVSGVTLVTFFVVFSFDNANRMLEITDLWKFKIESKEKTGT